VYHQGLYWEGRKKGVWVQGSERRRRRENCKAVRIN